MLFGTHNSGTYGSLQGCCTDIILPWTQNQSLTIEEQLDLGVQWLDLRITYSPDDGELYLSHTLRTTNRFPVLIEQLARRCRSATTVCPLVYIHVRVDYQDRGNAGIIAPLLQGLLRSYEDILCTKEKCGPTIHETSSRVHHKILLYCSDGTIQHPMVVGMELAPTIAFWNAGNVDTFELRLLALEELYGEQKNGPFLFPNDRLLIFDYSTRAPLWYTDREQRVLMQKHKTRILDAHPTILAGNMIQDILPIFS